MGWKFWKRKEQPPMVYVPSEISAEISTTVRREAERVSMLEEMVRGLAGGCGEEGE